MRTGGAVRSRMRRLDPRRSRRAALVLIGHGGRLAGANRPIREVARRLRLMFPGRIVQAGFLEARPDVAAAIALCVARGARRILIVPWFLSLGGHVKRDLPRLAARARARHPGTRIRVAPHLGSDPRLALLAAGRVRRGLAASRWS